MLVANLSGDAPGLHQAGLQVSTLLSEAHEHVVALSDCVCLLKKPNAATARMPSASP